MPSRPSMTGVLAIVCLTTLFVSMPSSVYAQEPVEPDAFVTVLDDIDMEFDPHRSIFTSEAQVFTALYEGLFSYDPSTLEPVKALCQSYTRSKDGKTYSFTLREGALWSDGSPITAEDFRNSWLRAMDPATKAEYSSFFDIIEGAREYRIGKAKDTSAIGIRTPSPRNLEVRLAHPAPWFTRLLSHHSFAPIHSSMLAIRDWRKAIPFPVSGPYEVASLNPERLEMVANLDYWDRDSVSIGRLVFIFTDDESGASRMFDSGEAHWLAGPMDFDALLGRDSILYNPLFATNYWFFASSAAPWNDERLRRALALLLPWQELRSSETYPIPASTLVLPHRGYEGVKGIEQQDRSAGLSLLAEAGYPEGSGLPPITILYPAGNDSRRIASSMKTAWESVVGIKVEVRSLPPAEYFRVSRTQIRSGEATLAQSTWIGDFADPLAFLQLWVSDSNLNDSGFNDPEYDRLIEASSMAENGERSELLKKAENRLLSGAALLPIYHGLSINVIDVDYITGWYTNPLDIHPYKYLRFGERQIRPNVAIRKPELSPFSLSRAVGTPHGDGGLR